MTNNHPRSFQEAVTKLREDERARWETRESFHDGKGDVALIRGYHGAWHVEWADDDGDYYVTAFAGPESETRARVYFHMLKNGALKVVRSGRPNREA